MLRERTQTTSKHTVTIWVVCCPVWPAVPPHVVLVCTFVIVAPFIIFTHTVIPYDSLITIYVWLNSTVHIIINHIVDATCSMCGKATSCTKSTATRGIYVFQFLLVSVVAYLFSNWAEQWLQNVPGITFVLLLSDVS